jgi:PHD/YefM family antitoxin component YafN of YafNO toxin-antitoxin module
VPFFFGYFLLGKQKKVACRRISYSNPLGKQQGLSFGTQKRTITTCFPKRITIMPTLTASEARSSLYRLIDEAATSHQTMLITGKRNNAVLVSEEDWAAIQETLQLVSIPGMRESIREGLQTPIEQCAETLEW